MAKIHPTAIVDPGAELADDVEVGAYAHRGGTCGSARAPASAPHCVIEGRTTIGATTGSCSSARSARAAGQEVRRRADASW